MSDTSSSVADTRIGEHAGQSTDDIRSAPETTSAPPAARTIARFWRLMDAADFAAAADLLSEAYVCDWPQSRERIRGRANFIAVNANYPGRWRITIQRLLAEGERVATEVTLTNGERTDRAVSFFELRDGLIAHEVDYWPEPYAAPADRAQWVEPLGEHGEYEG